MAEAVADAEREVEIKRKDHELVVGRFQARQSHVNTVEYLLIAKILGPKGVRATTMQTALQRLDKVLARIADITGWPRVALDKTYAVTIGGRTFLRVCAESEQLVAQYSLQISIARCMREPFVIFDRVDDLDSEHRAGLMKLLAALCSRPEPPAFLICGTEIDFAAFNPDGPNYLMQDGSLTLQ